MTANNFLLKVSQGGKFYELVRFVIVGGAATATDLAVTLVLFFLFPEMSENAITTCAFCVALPGRMLLAVRTFCAALRSRSLTCFYVNLGKYLYIISAQSKKIN